MVHFAKFLDMLFFKKLCEGGWLESKSPGQFSASSALKLLRVTCARLYLEITPSNRYFIEALL